MRDALKEKTFWDHWINHYVFEVEHRKERLNTPFAQEDYRPQYTYELAMCGVLR